MEGDIWQFISLLWLAFWSILRMISELQNGDKQLELLAAQRQLYSFAKSIQVFQIILSIPVPILLSLLTIAYPALKVYSGLYGFIITLTDLWIISPYQQRTKKVAATIQELFDCTVLQIDWCKLKVGEKPEPETIIAASSKYKSSHKNFIKLRDWYPTLVDEIPLHLGRIVCQRTNCYWDGNLRKRYASIVVFILVIFTISLFLISLHKGTSLEEFLLVVLFPLMPALVFGFRETRDNLKTAQKLSEIRKHCESLWERLITSSVDTQTAYLESRLLQNEIYDNRRNSPLIFDIIYNRLKSDYEERMNKGAEYFVYEAKRNGIDLSIKD